MRGGVGLGLLGWLWNGKARKDYDSPSEGIVEWSWKDKINNFPNTWCQSKHQVVVEPRVNRKLTLSSVFGHTLAKQHSVQRGTAINVRSAWACHSKVGAGMRRATWSLVAAGPSSPLEPFAGPKIRASPDSTHPFQMVHVIFNETDPSSLSQPCFSWTTCSICKLIWNFCMVGIPVRGCSSVNNLASGVHKTTTTHELQTKSTLEYKAIKEETPVNFTAN